jgi:tetratricopeptide (TPR) repeat protein
LALELQPSNFLVYVEKGNLNYYHLKYNEAIGDYTKAISLRSNLDGANYKLGFCHFYLKDTIKACKTWDKVGELDDFEEYEFIKTICKK